MLRWRGSQELGSSRLNVLHSIPMYTHRRRLSLTSLGYKPAADTATATATSSITRKIHQREHPTAPSA